MTIGAALLRLRPPTAFRGPVSRAPLLSDSDVTDGGGCPPPRLRTGHGLEAPLLIGSDTEGELFIEVVSLNKRYCQCILLLLNAYAGKTAK